MLVDTVLVMNEACDLQEKYGREIVIEAERAALKETRGFRPLTEPWVNIYLRERRLIAKRLHEKRNSATVDQAVSGGGE